MEQVRTTLLIKRNYYSKMFFQEILLGLSSFLITEYIASPSPAASLLVDGLQLIQYNIGEGRRHRLAKHWPHKTQHPVPNYFRIKNRLNRHKYNIFLLWLFPNSANFLIRAIYRRSRNDPITLPVLFAF